MARILALGMVAGLTAEELPGQQVTLPAGTALLVELDKPARVRNGQRLTGHLVEPVYLPDHEVVPAGARISGTIQGTRPGSRGARIQRLLAADFTPPRIPQVNFDRLFLPAQVGRPAAEIPIEAPGQITDATVLTLGVRNKKKSLRQRIAGLMAQSEHDLRETLQKPRIKETVGKWAIGQLPYHPDILWSKTHFSADLAMQATLPDVPHESLPIQDLNGRLPEGILSARLLTSLTSATAKHGDQVDAIVAKPLLSEDHSHILVPEGTHLHGKIMQSKPARSFGRNGTLRFTFTKLDLPVSETHTEPLAVHGRLSAAATAPGEHDDLDEEGQIRAGDGPAKYAEPAVLAVLASGATPDDHDTGGANLGTATVASNGFGLIARVVSLGTRNRTVVQGFAYYALAKSIYFRFLSKGHDTTFQHDAELRVTLTER